MTRHNATELCLLWFLIFSGLVGLLAASILIIDRSIINYRLMLIIGLSLFLLHTGIKDLRK